MADMEAMVVTEATVEWEWAACMEAWEVAVLAVLVDMEWGVME